MSNLVKAFALSADITLTPGQRLAVASQGAFSVYQKSTFANVPPQTILLSAVAAGGNEFLSAVFANGGIFAVQADGGDDLFWEQGTDAVVKQTRAAWNTNGTAGVLNTTGALTAAMILARRVTSTTAAAVTGTVPTGAVLEAAATWTGTESWDWEMINTGPNTFDLAPASGHTLVGGAGAAIAAATLTSVWVNTRRVSAGVFVSEARARAVS